MNKLKIYQILNQIEDEIHSVIENRYNRNKKFQHIMVAKSVEAAVCCISRDC